MCNWVMNKCAVGKSYEAQKRTERSDKIVAERHIAHGHFHLRRRRRPYVGRYRWLGRSISVTSVNCRVPLRRQHVRAPPTADHPRRVRLTDVYRAQQPTPGIVGTGWTSAAGLRGHYQGDWREMAASAAASFLNNSRRVRALINCATIARGRHGYCPCERWWRRLPLFALQRPLARHATTSVIVAAMMAVL